MKIVCMLGVLNDEDIIREVIEHLIAQGLQLVILDNGSTDKTLEICKEYLDKGVLTLKQIHTSWYKWDLILRMLYDLTIEQNPEWVIRSDADEFLESGQERVTLKDAITKVDSAGFNLIQFDRFDFFMTDKDDQSEHSVKKKMPYYSCQGDHLYRAWKYKAGITIGDADGHYPIFPEGEGYKIFPNKFVLRHYTFRSKEQAEKKMAVTSRGIKENKKDKKLNRHVKLVLEQDFTKRFDHKLLTKYEEDGNWNLEKKICPYAWVNPPKRDDLFTKDGKLRLAPKSVTDYRLLLDDERTKNSITSLIFKITRYLKRKLEKNKN